MSTAKHTPGESSDDEISDEELEAEFNKLLDLPLSRVERVRNAGPALLAALEAVLPRVRPCDPLNIEHDPEIIAARAAIALNKENERDDHARTQPR